MDPLDVVAVCMNNWSIPFFAQCCISAPYTVLLTFLNLPQKCTHIWKYHITDLKQYLFPRRVWKHMSEELGYTSSKEGLLREILVACVSTISQKPCT